MTPTNKELAHRFSTALALLYCLMAARYYLTFRDPSQAAFVQCLVLGWGFALSALVTRIVPTRVPPPHLNRM